MKSLITNKTQICNKRSNNKPKTNLHQEEQYVKGHFSLRIHRHLNTFSMKETPTLNSKMITQPSITELLILIGLVGPQTL